MATPRRVRVLENIAGSGEGEHPFAFVAGEIVEPKDRNYIDACRLAGGPNAEYLDDGATPATRRDKAIGAAESREKR